MFYVSSFRKNGFSIIEILIVVFITVIFFGVVLANYKSGQDKFKLERSAYRLAQDIRRAQTMAGLEESECSTPDDYEYGYGIYLDETNDEEYILFADCNGNYYYDANDEVIEIIEFEEEIIINNLKIDENYPSVINITFTPPDPSIDISESLGANPGSLAEITITNQSIIESIKVNKAGLINVE